MKDLQEIKKLVTDSKHFCVLPWVHFHAWPDSRVMPCCVADSNMPVSHIKSEETIIQMVNSDAYKKMRLAMLNDEPSAECKRCYDLELIGTWTMRLSHNKRKGLDYVEEIAKTNDDGSVDEFKMKYMDIRFSNLCNMKCRSCGPSCSSQWAQEIIDYHGPEHYQKYFGTTKMIINNNEDQKFITKLKPYLKDVTEVYFAGGEIIITPEHYECLDYWVDNNLTDQVELTYTTNFSVLKYKDKDLISYWKKFPNLKIWASLDGAGETAEILRKGTDWRKIVRNIEKVKHLVPHAEFQITPTVSIWNVFSFPEFFDMMLEKKLITDTITPRFNLATHPWYANIMILPQFVKNKLIKKCYAYEKKYSYHREIANGFAMIRYNLQVGEENKGGIQEFIKFNDDLDTIRNETLIDVIPELKEVYEWARS